MEFDEALRQHKDNLAKNLSEFGEGHRINRLQNEIDSNAADYEYYFNAGQENQQSKVDDLQRQVELLKSENLAMQAHIDELESDFKDIDLKSGERIHNGRGKHP